MNGRIFCKVMGFLFLLVAVYSAIRTISKYCGQLDAQDWRVSTAVVTSVNSRRGGSSGRYMHSETVYDIDYEYNVNGDIYTGKITGIVSPKKVGDMLDIKWDPHAPENSTSILEPQPDVLILRLGVACVIAMCGLWGTGLWEQITARIRRMRKGGAKQY